MSEHCPLCNALSTEIVLSIENCVDSSGSIIQEKTSTYFCRDCQNFYKQYEDLSQAKIRMQGIYEEYVLHSVDNHQETSVRFDLDPRGIPKSQHIFNYIKPFIRDVKMGSVLDIGCHFGAFLKALKNDLPEWKLSGLDISERFRKEIESISPNSRFYLKNMPDQNKKFDLITLTHVLEHIENIPKLLSEIKSRLAQNGTFFIQCNDAENNPFLPLIFEQYYNFSAKGVTALLEQNGFRVLDIKNDWINKELTIVTKLFSSTHAETLQKPTPEVAAMTEKQRYWHALKSFIAAQQGSQQKVAIFGTTYASRWLGFNIDDSVVCYVDEDKQQCNQLIMDKPVVKPESVPEGISILMLFPDAIAQLISQRLQFQTQGIFCLPPHFHRKEQI